VRDRLIGLMELDKNVMGRVALEEKLVEDEWRREE
jgi:hypothetical protein